MKINDIEKRLKISFKTKFKEEIKERIFQFISSKLEEIEANNLLEKIIKCEEYVNIKNNKVNKIKEKFYEENGEELILFLNPIWYKNNVEKKSIKKELKYKVEDIYNYIREEVNCEVGHFLKRYGRTNRVEGTYKEILKETEREVKELIEIISFFHIKKLEYKDIFDGFNEKEEIVPFGEYDAKRKEISDGKEILKKKYQYDLKREEIVDEENKIVKMNGINSELKDNVKEKKVLAVKMESIKIKEFIEEEIIESKLKEMIKEELNEYLVFSAKARYKTRKGRILKFSKLAFLKKYGYTYRVEKEEEKGEETYFCVYLEKMI